MTASGWATTRVGRVLFVVVLLVQCCLEMQAERRNDGKCSAWMLPMPLPSHATPIHLPPAASLMTAA